MICGSRHCKGKMCQYVRRWRISTKGNPDDDIFVWLRHLIAMSSDRTHHPPFDFAHAPGHLIRRAHQVSVALFMQEAAAHDVTQVQFAILNALIDRPGLDQVTLAQAVALDAATSGSVIGRLEAKGWIRRESDLSDRRRRLLWVTDAGKAVVAALMEPIARSQERLMAPLDAHERVELMRLLRKVFMRECDNSSRSA